MKKPNPFLNLALEQARKAYEIKEVPIGAVVVFEDRVVGSGFNRKETQNDPISHAEIEAIQEASKALGRWRLTGCTLYTTLEPCPMCLGACVQSRIDRLVYGARDPKGGAFSLGFSFNSDERLNHSFDAIFEESPECGRILSDFFKERRACND